MSEDISQLTVRQLLSDSGDYLIPMYQRNYAWDEAEITQLIQDIIDYEPGGKNYFIGTLVVFEREHGLVYETIDGQQRMTTFSLLASYLKNETDGDFAWYKKLTLDFESRENSRKTFASIFSGSTRNDPATGLRKTEINTAILHGYYLIQKILPQKLKEHKLNARQFADYMFEKVVIMRVQVPRDTDLNHYFEIMNNRGEQLEKHEVLKARMLEVLDKIEDVTDRLESQTCLDEVWEACSNMEKYVQMGFSPTHRDKIFGAQDWSRFDVRNFSELQKVLAGAGKGAGASDNWLTLDAIIADSERKKGKENTDEEAPERFNTVINFPNFLLHVLRLTTGRNIPLDDKQLISLFDTHVIRITDSITTVKNFIFHLLRCKYLYDHYVIKREFLKGEDGWSLKRLKWTDGGEKSRSGKANYVNTFESTDGAEEINRRILMLLSAFHVSTPTMVYKHWLNAAMHYLFHADEVRAEDYLKHLESVAKAFVFDRFLAPRVSLDYYDIIYAHNGSCQTRRHEFRADHLQSQLSFGNIENNLIFNFLDYLLWLEHKKDPVILSYEFTFRSSVEHYYPQNPQPGFEALPTDVLNSFGNLCLISHSKNSRLSNFTPKAKKEYYAKNDIDSIKQWLMMKTEPWDKNAIASHYDAMTTVLLGCLEGTGQDE